MEPYQAFYGTREKWDDIRSQVIKTLMAEHYASH
jgi:hypothetical protein